MGPHTAHYDTYIADYILFDVVHALLSGSPGRLTDRLFSSRAPVNKSEVRDKLVISLIAPYTVLSQQWSI